MKFLDSKTIEDTGMSGVVVRHKGKKYCGTAKCHPEDQFSEFTGCRYAHERAEIKALKAEYKQKKHDCDVCRKFVKTLSQYKVFDNNSPIVKAMWRQINLQIRDVNKLAEEISKKQFNLATAIRMQDGFENKINQKKLKNS